MATFLLTGAGSTLVPFPIEPKIAHAAYQKVTLTRTVHQDRRLVEIPVIYCRDAELICRCILQFKAACLPSALHLSTAARKFEEFGKCLSDAYQVVWNGFRQEQPETEQGFHECLRLFRAKYIKRGALANQQMYFMTYKKPRRMDCEDLCDRLREINKLTKAVLNDKEPFWTELHLKAFFFSMMPQRYQLEFNRSSDRDITDPDFSLDALAAVMQTMKITENMQEVNRRRREGPQGDQRPQKMRRFNNGGRGWNGGGRWNHNKNWASLQIP